MIWYGNALRALTLFKSLGPQLIMIKEMVLFKCDTFSPLFLIHKILNFDSKLKPLLVFLIIGVVFLLAVGVSTQALMYPNSDLDYDLLKNVFYPAYFIIGGEYYKLDDMLDGIQIK